MRVSKDKHTTREASFKADKISDTEMEEFEAKFVRRLKTGSGKYKGKFPFKCFNCGKVRHYVSKSPHKKKDQNHVDEEKHTFKKYNKNKNYRKKSLCVNDGDSSKVMDSESSCEEKPNDFNLMAIEKFEGEYAENDQNNEEVEVDMEGELISALEEIDRLKLKKRKQKRLLTQYEKNVEEPSADCALIKLELEESKKKEYVLRK